MLQRSPIVSPCSTRPIKLSVPAVHVQLSSLGLFFESELFDGGMQHICLPRVRKYEPLHLCVDLDAEAPGQQGEPHLRMNFRGKQSGLSPLPLVVKEVEWQL